MLLVNLDHLVILVWICRTFIDSYWITPRIEPIDSFHSSWWNCNDRWYSSIWCIKYFPSRISRKNMDMNVFHQATRFLTQGTHPFMMFGLPGACYAMYKTAYAKEQPKVRGYVISFCINFFCNWNH